MSFLSSIKAIKKRSWQRDKAFVFTSNVS